jgi:DNA-directed RNA polymerase subunit RPC12/RpoP
MQTYECPGCEEEVKVGDSQLLIKCPMCNHDLIVCRDAEFVNGMWKDLTTLVRIVKPKNEHN